MQHSLTIVLSGEAGQGLQTLEDFIVEAAGNDYYVFSTKEIMSRVRGGNNTVEIRLADERVMAYQEKIDYLFLLNDHAYDRLTERVTEETMIFGEEDFFSGKEKGKPQIFPLGELAKEAGNKLYANTILFGYIAGLLAFDQDYCNELIDERFGHLEEKVLEENKEAFKMGRSKSEDVDLPKTVKKNEKASELKILNGTAAVGIGALAGGCNFVSSYPMSPSTALLVFMSQHAKEFGVLVEQAEDEIAALNMVVAGWYAGARGLATTSGGGFALMEEALSLSGITETPCVIHIAQRPGPATGLPTRTEQGDLNLAVYGGHGEFPRIVLAPGYPEDAIKLSQRAFWLADKYQVPVFILTDQYFVDSFWQMERFELEEDYLEESIVETEETYLRYALSDHPLSPRGIPGRGKGLVKVDSDEHTEEGLITEDFNVRIDMNEKRLAKEDLLLDDYQDVELVGPENFAKLIIGWGSTYGVLKEYIDTCDREDVAFLYVKQVYPLHNSILDLTDQAEQIVVIENNATGQFAKLMKLELDVEADDSILKYNGEPFSIEEIDEMLEEVLV